MSCISEYLINDKDAFILAVSETIRVLKPGSKLKLYPWPNEAIYNADAVRRNSMNGLTAYLIGNNIPYSVNHLIQQN